MFVNEYKNQNATVLELSGRLDMAGSIELENALGRVYDAASGDVILDMANVNYVNSTGIRVLVRFYQLMQRTNRRMVMAGMSQNVQRTFDLVGLQTVFNPYATIQAALTGI